MDDKLNIYQRINAVKADPDLELYIKKGSAGQGTGAQYDSVISTLGPILTRHGIVVTVDKDGESSSRATAKGAYIYQCDFKISYINIDAPEDRVINIVESHAIDLGDKATGKANTYAAKTSMLKVFGFETGDNEESRAEIADQKNTINQLQHDNLAIYCLNEDKNGWSSIGAKVSSAYNIPRLDLLPESKFKEALERCQNMKAKMKAK